jgi:hypothetical protein
MITDGMTLYIYYRSWQAGSLPVFFWLGGAFFMVLPSFVCTVSMAAWYHCHNFPAHVNWILPTIMFELFYCVTIPCIAICAKGKALFWGETENESSDREAQSAWNVIEILFEAMPQVSDSVIKNPYICRLI